MGQPRPLFRLSLAFFKQTSLQFLQQICEKGPSSIRCRDLNPRPSERESLPITTRSELPPIHFFLPLFNKVALPVKLFGFRVEV